MDDFVGDPNDVNDVCRWLVDLGRVTRLHRDIAVVTSDHCYEIRKLHQQSAYGPHCRECNRVYPCPTIQILDRGPSECSPNNGEDE